MTKEPIPHEVSMRLDSLNNTPTKKQHNHYKNVEHAIATNLYNATISPWKSPYRTFKTQTVELKNTLSDIDPLIVFVKENKDIAYNMVEVVKKLFEQWYQRSDIKDWFFFLCNLDHSDSTMKEYKDEYRPTKLNDMELSDIKEQIINPIVELFPDNDESVKYELELIAELIYKRQWSINND